MPQEQTVGTLDLGHALAPAPDGLTQCRYFKALMLQRIGTGPAKREPAGIAIMTKLDCDPPAMLVEYEPGNRVSEKRARDVADCAKEVWDEVIQAENTKIVARSKGWAR
jgi:hypothetical protein